MASDDSLNKTEPATPRRREEAREEGQVAKSRELASVAVLLVNCMILMWAGGYTISQMAAMTHKMLGTASRGMLDIPAVIDLAKEIIIPALALVWPFAVASIAATLLANIAQVGWLFTLKPLAPSWEKIDPISGVKKLVSKHAFGELVKSILKIVLVSFVAYQGFRIHMLELISLADGSVGDMGNVLGRVAVDILWRVVGLLIVLSALDFFYQRWLFEEELKMSPEEVKEELKQREGDPKVKSRIRRMQRELTRQRLAEAVPTADVVITNPRRVAVAVRYEAEEMDAPIVVAKGAGHLANMVRKLARQNGVPVIENRFLARALYKSVEVGELIPYDLYQAVAEILAYIFWLRKRD
jgi:flagellar biosynthetic protein FlhB